MPGTIPMAYSATVLSLPTSSSSLLVRTDFSDDLAWRRVCEIALGENEDGFRAYADPVNDPAFEGASWEAVRSALPATTRGAFVLFVVDAVAVADPDHPVLVVGLAANRDEPPFRCVPAELWGVDNNLNICNMDWDEFATATDEDGVFRGFPTG